MKLKLLKPIDFRDQKLKKGAVVDMPEGIAQKLILSGTASKAGVKEDSSNSAAVAKAVAAVTEAVKPIVEEPVVLEEPVVEMKVDTESESLMEKASKLFNEE